MKRVIKRFLFIWVIFSVGLFFGEWLLDILFNSERNSLKIEIIECVIIGLIVAVLMIIGNKSLRKGKSQGTLF